MSPKQTIPIAEPVDLTGWERQSTIDEPRLSELVELYQGLGLEVMLRPVDANDLGGACAECYLADRDRYRTIYTRPKRDGG